jgi:hypothetical protein
MELKEFLKLPFANYDLVVYFGGGLFFIPFLNRYLISPLNLQWPTVGIDTHSVIANEAVSIMSLLFTIYIFGHLLSYLSSQFVEKNCDNVLGTTSSIIVFTSVNDGKDISRKIRSKIIENAKSNFNNGSKISFILRGFLAWPLILALLIIFTLGLFGNIRSRFPQSLFNELNSNGARLKIGMIDLSKDAGWFKPLEFFVINRSPESVSRMYNYLIIHGLFRTLAFIFLFNLWAIVIIWFFFRDDIPKLLPPALGFHGSYSLLWECAFTIFLLIFCTLSMLKFQRRYAEEAMFSFAYDKALD